MTTYPFTYDVEVAVEDGEGTEKFTFTLKSVSDVPVGILRRHRHDQDEQVWATFEWGLPKDQIDTLDRLTASQFADLLAAWQESVNKDQDKPEGPPKTPDADAPQE